VFLSLPVAIDRHRTPGEAFVNDIVNDIKDTKEVPGARAAVWPDERLIKECLKGNQDAWSALIRKYRNLIHSIPLKYGLSRDDAADIFQQVCVQLLTALPQIREPKSLTAWIIKVTSHACFRWTRYESRFKAVAAGQTLNEPFVSIDLPDPLAAELEREQMLREALGQVAPRCRELLRMLFYEKPAVPYEEVARKLGLATGSIGFTRMRCLKRLRQVLEENEFS
jgi:RNA polymerase sigma factor (sigma-70 family)